MESLNLQGREVKTERLCDCIEARLRGSVGVKSTLEKMSFTFCFCDFHDRGQGCIFLQILNTVVQYPEDSSDSLKSMLPCS